MKAARLLRVIPALAVLFLPVVAIAFPGFDEVKRSYEASDALLLDRNGVTLQAQRLDRKALRLPWVALDSLSQAMRNTLILSEDRSFYRHAGVDWKAIAAAAWDYLGKGGKKARGASTLTMQLAGLLDPALQPKYGSRTPAQKWDQIMAAREIEKTWSKQQILEGYLNLVPFRGELIGINAASQRLFGKHPSGLNRNEALLLAALLREPNASASKVSRRACALGSSMSADIDCNFLHGLAISSFESSYQVPQDNLAPHLARRLLAKPGKNVRATLEVRLQRFVIDVMSGHLTELSARNVEDAAVIVLDNASGDVLAYVGSSGRLSAASEVDGVIALRQAGSTLKPFLYGLALEKRLLTAASVLDDSPLSLATPSGLYIPQNYDKDFKGPVSLRIALASSLNVPAVRTLALIGLDEFYNRLRSAGLDSLTETAQYYGYSLALGAGEVSLLSLTNAYRVLANAGVWKPVRFRMDEPKGRAKRVMDARASYIVGDILSDASARALAFGLDNPLAVRTWAAVKTGTSKDMRDNWCIGFTDRYTVGVWVGNFSGAPMWDVSGVTGAAPIWRDVIHYLHQGRASTMRKPPAGLLKLEVQFDTALDPARKEWFLAGTEPANLHIKTSGANAITPRIVYPENGTIIALDPDIPRGHQRLEFVAKPAGLDLHWALDGKKLTSGDGPLWEPDAGLHRLALSDAAGREIDAVEFEVRGKAAQP